MEANHEENCDSRTPDSGLRDDAGLHRRERVKFMIAGHEHENLLAVLVVATVSHYMWLGGGTNDASLTATSRSLALTNSAIKPAMNIPPTEPSTMGSMS